MDRISHDESYSDRRLQSENRTICNRQRVAVASSDTKNIRLVVPFSLWSFGENVDIVFDGDEIMELKSTCRYPFQVQDWGKNKANIDRLRLIHCETRDGVGLSIALRAKLGGRVAVEIAERDEVLDLGVADTANISARSARLDGDERVAQLFEPVGDVGVVLLTLLA